ncbi:hypothetical protein AB0E96_11895 [Kitasatospora sp. NPDC036755]
MVHARLAAPGTEIARLGALRAGLAHRIAAGGSDVPDGTRTS